MTNRKETGWAAGLKPALFLGFVVGCGGGDSGSVDRNGDDTNEPAEPVPAAAEEPLTLDESLLPEGVTVAMVEEGRELFSGGGTCQTCHLDGTGGPLGPDLTDDAWLNVDGEYLSIVELIKTGVSQPVEHPGTMLPRAGMHLTDAQVEALAAYVYMLSRM
ncbi:MAG: c-type cytochrome [Gemmatimonadota bacterium]|nr:c-type cytochrome [Gemmatimonadota bacterium]